MRGQLAMSRSEIHKFSSLRTADTRADHDFFKQLSDKTIINIDRLGAQGTDGVSLSTLKSYMGINYQVLTKVIKALHSKQLVALRRRSGVESADSTTSDDIILKLTAEGSTYVRNVLYAMQVTE
ncbi:TPA: hypothetical protein I7769_17990 [Vibrio vulnificus]|nr:hypothetical protein [Vibrio vulnificus]